MPKTKTKAVRPLFVKVRREGENGVHVIALDEIILIQLQIRRKANEVDYFSIETKSLGAGFTVTCDDANYLLKHFTLTKARVGFDET